MIELFNLGFANIKVEIGKSIYTVDGKCVLLTFKNIDTGVKSEKICCNKEDPFADVLK